MSNKDIVSRIKEDYKTLNAVVKFDKDKNALNPIQLKGVKGSNHKDIGAKLSEIDEKARTKGESLPIGSLYGYNIFVQTETSMSDPDLHRNKFYIEGEGHIRYTYNNGNIASDPKLASYYFLNALEKMKPMIISYENETKQLSEDLIILQEIINGEF